MIKKSLYGFNTFAGLKVGEIQLKTNVEDWFHIPSEENIADCLTKGLSLSKLNSGSKLQDNPGQLKSDWPIQQGRNDISTDKIEREMSRYQPSAGARRMEA